MADITITKTKAEFNWLLSRGASSATRTFSVDDIPFTQAGKSAAVEFRDIFIGAASSPLSIIDPTKFWQPTGWRDSDESEDEWTTTGCNLSIIRTEEWQVDGGRGGSSSARNIVITGADDPQDSIIHITFDNMDLSSSGKPQFAYLNDQDTWVNGTVSFDSSEFYITKTSSMRGKQGYIIVQASNDGRTGEPYPPDVKTFNIA